MGDMVLSACPFCGGTDDLSIRDGAVTAVSEYRYRVICGSCWAQGPITKSEHDAATEWNERASVSNLDKFGAALAAYENWFAEHPQEVPPVDVALIANRALV